MNPFVCVQLSGGLGNQMFQYAAGRAIAAANDVALVIDPWSGFVRDLEYRRQYELGALPITSRPATALERAPFWFERLQDRIFGSERTTPVRRCFYGDSIRETRRAFLPEVQAHSVRRPCWMTGYWQTARYFSVCASAIRTELTPAAPESQRMRDLGALMQRTNSVALGIRLYEEAKRPELHTSDGRLKSYAEISAAAQQLAGEERSLHFFVFCTHRAPGLEELRLPGEVTYVTHDEGYHGTLGRLWLLTQCRHHVLTNSTYYWWGAWLAATHPGGPARVFAADNFVNADCVEDGWQRF